MSASVLFGWPAGANQRLDDESFVIRHRLGEHEAFSDASLARLLDDYPRERLEVATMGLGRSDWTDWHPVDARGVSGRDLLNSIRVGKLWAKLMRVDLLDGGMRELTGRLIAEIQGHCPRLEILWTQPSLLISSSQAQVYYHADAFPTMLAHIRGRKRVWIYPLNDRRFVSVEALEEIIAGRVDRMAPYREEFDLYAQVHDLLGGDLLYWPPHAPHRVVSVAPLNVTLSICYESGFSYRRRQLYMANRELRRLLGVQRPSTADSGLGAAVKMRVYGAMRRLGLLKSRKIDPEFAARYRIDPGSPAGVSLIPGGPTRLPFLGNRAIRAESAPYYD